MRFDLAAISETGPRSQNEDCAEAWELDEYTVGLVVADGLGGRGSGGAASALAVSLLRERVTSFPKSSNALVTVFQEIHRQILSEQKKSEQQRFMATTLTAVFLGETKLVGAHAGDTRAMIARGQGIKKLTSDHSEAQRLFDEGKIDKIQFRNYPRKHILESALGAEGEPRIDGFEFSVQVNDRIFVTSDGLHSKLPLRPMLEISNRFPGANNFAQEATENVRRNSPDDNFSIAVAYLKT
ncbi:PP2C family serine/threonine-protein phosphatase [Roseobacter sp. OBYS 0001]|uniref:PP2C family protein-serine/threonine phosphatase n=1 Tax=Roseobacter sp. OBYS 0001 TaxID=882651 RepID=UPI001C81CBC7|nr:PP2C family serine/threonine-protein phosphatase [Roseobacter sp. OBYS 0001]